MADIVGVVAVKVVADATGLGDSIKQRAQKAGGEGSKSFRDAWNKDFRRNEYFAELRKRAQKDAAAVAGTINKELRRGVAPIDIELNFSEQTLGTINRWAADMEAKFGDVASNIDNELIAAYRKAFGEVIREQDKALKQEERQLQQSLVRQERQLQQALKQALKQEERQRQQEERQLQQSLKRQERERVAAAAAAEKAASKARVAASKEAEKALAAALRDFEKNRTRSLAIDIDIEKTRLNISRASNTIEMMLASSMARAGKEGGENFDYEFNNRFTRGITRARGEVTKFSTIWVRSLRRAGTGGFFDTLTNFIAIFVRGIANAIEVTLEFGKALGQIGVELFKTVQESVRSGEKFSTIVGQIAAAVAMAAADVVGLVVALVVMGATFEAIVIASGLLAAALSAIAGLLTIFASAAFSAVSALGILVPGLLSVVAGFIAMTAAVTKVVKPLSLWNKYINETDPKEKAKALDEYNKSLAGLGKYSRQAVRDLIPLVSSLKEARDIVAEKFFEGLGEGLRVLEPLITVLANGFGQVALALGDSLGELAKLFTEQASLETFGRALESWGPILGNIVLALGQISLGLLDFFTAISPVTSLATSAFLGLADAFAQMFQNEEQRDKVTQFFMVAYQAAGTLLQIIWVLADAFFTLFTNSSQEGQSLLDKILELAERFRTWIDEVSSDGRLQTWLQDAKTFGEDVVNVIKALKDTFVALNTEETREGLRLALKLGELIIAAFRIAAGVVLGFIDNIQTLIGAVKSLFSWLGRVLGMQQRVKSANPTQRPGTNFTEYMSGHSSAAAGKIVTTPTRLLTGENGAEAVIPLTRPLSLVDPSVRGMAAMLRGGGGGGSYGGKTITNNITVQSMANDPHAVAQQVVNRAAIMAMA